MYGRNLKAYNRTKIEAEINVASPYRVTQMLFDGLIERLNQAKGYMASGDMASKAIYLSKAQGILNGLQSAIDPSYDEELGFRIISLYEYFKLKLTEANTNNDPAPIDEVLRMFTPIKEAWDNIPPEIRDEQNAVILKKFEEIDAKQRESNRRGFAFSE